ncbi:GPI inositol-deacylase-like [Actinia tenebrosa]|uniref:GPI inositol-deacylase n=1 Tax=Actinia tenebrosa TaxID=6105 RepID=A0A6P8J5Y9_ACTTE|nr:GPI inositol-deacylase-like [Actinia tenebrosa]
MMTVSVSPVGQSAMLMMCLAVFALIALHGFRDVVRNIEPNKCDMTYMYQWPEYVKVPLFKGTSKLFPRYSLHLYGEGSRNEVSQNLKTLKGIPVLFIPGNAGSHKQVRSLASVALRKAEDNRYEFNYFTVDLDERLSGIFGIMLDEQTEFVRLCITKILRLYQGLSNRPKSVILIGHSMGGVIAKALFTLPKFDPQLVHTIITLGTPHQHPVLSLDPFLCNFYNRIKKYWNNEVSVTRDNSTLRNVTVVSVSGGFRDLLVRSSTTSLQNYLDHSQAISVVTTSIPRVWLSVDHLCLCWCKQLVLVINRALFDMIDSTTGQISLSKELRRRVFHHHFIQNPGTKKIYFGNSKKNSGIDWKEFNPVVVHRRLWVFKGGHSGKKSNKLYTFPLEEWRITHNAFLILTDLESDSWLFACKKSSSSHPCSTPTDLSHHAQLLPSGNSPLKFVYLRLSEFPEISHFAIMFPPSKTADVLKTEFHSLASSSFKLDSPWMFSRSPVTADIEEDLIFSNISLASVSKVWKVLDIIVETKDCEIEPSIIGRVNIPWFNEDVYSHVSSGSLRLQIKLHHPRPRGFVGNIEVHLWLDPKCSHRVSIEPNLTEMIGQVYRFFGVQLPVWVYSMLLLVLAWQVSTLASSQDCRSFFDLITSLSRSARVLLLLTQVHFVISQVILPFFVMQGHLGQHDWLPSINDLRTFDWLLPLVIIMSTAVLLTVILFVWNGVCLRFGGRVMFWKQDYQDLLFPKSIFPLKEISFAIVNTMISFTVCGTLGLVIAYLFFLGRSCKQFSLLRQIQSSPGDSRSKKLAQVVKNVCNFSLTVSTLTMLMVISNAPALVVWIKAFPYTYILSPDPTAFLGALMGWNLIHLGYHPLGNAPQSLVYVTFLVGVIVSQAPIFPLHMVSYAPCLVLATLNISRINALLRERNVSKKK